MPAAAFRSPDSKQVAVVVINAGKSARAIAPRVSGTAGYRLAQVHVTDRKHRCEAVPWRGSLTGESVTTLIYQAE